MTKPTYVVIKLDEPCRHDDAQDVAEHLVASKDFPDVEWARPATHDGCRLVLTGEAVSS